MPKNEYEVETPPQDRDAALFEKKLLDNPEINAFFGSGWIYSNIRIRYRDDRKEIHPLFWAIVTSDNFLNGLVILQSSYNRFSSLIKQLKEDKDNFWGLVVNIEIFYEYRLRHSDVLFQPLIPNSKKQGDIKVVIGGIEYWGEILTINWGVKDKELDETDEGWKESNDDARIKGKFLDKLEEFQFPKGEGIKRFFVLKLFGGADISDVDNALSGQSCAILNSARQDISWGRNPNGIVHHPEGSRQLGKVDFIVIIDQRGKKQYIKNHSNSENLEFFKSNF
ncbi:MAG: hypothetical protein PHT59_01610 [Candidatus Omnitrophica bacterium]|nr:hypothetical protein [Candidatus Omnitrophota bacterium]